MLEYLELALIILLLVLVFGFSVRQHWVDSKRAKAGWQAMLVQFGELEESLAMPISEYDCFRNSDQGVWLVTEFEAFKQSVLGSYTVNKNQSPQWFCQFKYKIDEVQRHIYFYSYSFTDSPEVDWDSFMHHEAWVSTPNPIKGRIDRYNAERRRRSRGAQWWEFWKFDDFS